MDKRAKIFPYRWYPRFLAVTLMIASLVLFWSPSAFNTFVPRSQRPSGSTLPAQRAGGYEKDQAYAKVPVRLGYINGLSKGFTNARGTAEIDFESAQVTVNVQGLAALPAGEVYQVWLVDQPGERSSVVIDSRRGADVILKVGALLRGGSHLFSVNPADLLPRQVDMVAVMRVAPERQPELVIAGMQSVFFKMKRHGSRRDRDRFDWFVTKADAATGLVALIKKGQDVFFNETFDGNGRTCGTCHPAGNSLTIDPAFIATLPPTDPLFVAEFTPALSQTFENPTLMRTFGLILENVDGFDDLANKFVMRAVPTVLNTRLTGPFGLGGDIPDLQAFSFGAVFQHFPKTLNRVDGVDFRLPTVLELEALEAFMRSLLFPTEVTQPGFSPFDFFPTTDAAKRGAALFQAGVAGRPAIRGSAGRCAACHVSPTLGNTDNFNTGVNGLAFSKGLPFDDGGANTGGSCGSDLVLRRTGTCDGGSFNVPQLIGLRTPFFHNGAAQDLREAVEFYISAAFASSTGARFLKVATGGSIVLNTGDIDDLVAFLESMQ